MTADFVFRTREQGQPNQSSPQDRSLLKAEASETRGAYVIRVNDSVLPGQWVAPHIHHAEEEAWYVLSGQLTFSIGDHRLLAPTGSFVLVPRHTVHSFGNTGTEAARYLQIFSPPGMDAYFAERTALAQAMATDANRDSSGLDPEVHKALARKYNMELV